MWSFDKEELCRTLDLSGKDSIDILVKLMTVFVNTDDSQSVKRTTNIYHGTFHKTAIGKYAYDLTAIDERIPSVTISMPDDEITLGSKTLCGTNKDKGASARIHVITGYMITDKIDGNKSYLIRGCDEARTVCTDFVKAESYIEAESLATNIANAFICKPVLKKSCTPDNTGIEILEIMELHTKNIAKTYNLTKS